MRQQTEERSWPRQGVQADLVSVIARAREVWAEPLHQHYTDHSVTHSERVLSKLERMASFLTEPLNETEEKVLCAAAYLHDVGMQYRRGQYIDPDQARRAHHDISSRWIEGSANPHERDHWPSLGLEAMPDLVHDIAVVAAGHREVDLSGDTYSLVLRSDDHVRLRLLAAMLRLADALDMDYKRVFIDRLMTEEVPLASRLHWWKCHYVSGVEVASDHTIAVHLRLPDSQHKYPIRAAVDAEVLRALADVETALWPEGIRLRYCEPVVRTDTTLRQMSHEELLALSDHTMREWRRLALPEPKYFVAWYAQIEELPSQLVAHSEEIETTEPYRAAKLSWRAMREYSALGFIRKAIELAERSARLCMQSSKHGAAYASFLEAGRLLQQSDNHDWAGTCYRAAQNEAKSRGSLSRERTARIADESTRVMLGGGVADVPALAESGLPPCPPWLRRQAALALAWAHAHDCNWIDGARVLESFGGEEPDPQARADLLLDAAYMQARAGAFDEAGALARSAVEAAEPASASALDIWARVRARAGLVDWLCADKLGAMAGFRSAIQAADTCGDVRGRAVNRRNLFILSYRSGEASPAREADWNFGADLEARTLDDYERARNAEYYGLQAHRAGQPRDALFWFHSSRHRHLRNGNLAGVEEAEKHLAELLTDIGDISGAVVLYAGLGAKKELDTICKALAASGTSDTILEVLSRCRSLAVTPQCRVAYAAMVTQLWEFVPDNDVRSDAELLLTWTSEPPHSSATLNVPRAAFEALGMLAFRGSDDLAAEVRERCIGVLSGDSHWTTLGAQMQCLSLAARNRDWPAPDVMRSVDAVRRHLRVADLAGGALARMSELVRPGTAPATYVQGILEDEASGGDYQAANILVQLYDPVPKPEVLRPTIGLLRQQYEREASAAPGASIALGGLASWVLGYYAPYLAPQELVEFCALAVRTAANPSMVLAQRESAAEAVRLLAPRLPRGSATAAWDSLLPVALEPLQTSGGIQMMLASQQPLSPGHINAGTPSDVQARCLITLAAISRNVGAGARARFCAHLLEAFHRSSDSTLLCGVIAAAGALFPSVTRAQQRSLFLRVHGSLAHPNLSVMRTALVAVCDMVPRMTPEQVAETIMAVRPLLEHRNPSARIQALFAWRELRSVGTANGDDFVERVGRMAHEDPSWRVRGEARDAIAAAPGSSTGSGTPSGVPSPPQG